MAIVSNGTEWRYGYPMSRYARNACKVKSRNDNTLSVYGCALWALCAVWGIDPGVCVSLRSRRDVSVCSGWCVCSLDPVKPERWHSHPQAPSRY